MTGAREDAASYGPESSMVFVKPVDKHGSEVADRSVMTAVATTVISIRRVQGFSASGRVLRTRENDGEET